MVSTPPQCVSAAPLFPWAGLLLQPPASLLHKAIVPPHKHTEPVASASPQGRAYPLAPTSAVVQFPFPGLQGFTLVFGKLGLLQRASLLGQGGPEAPKHLQPEITHRFYEHEEFSFVHAD